MICNIKKKKKKRKNYYKIFNFEDYSVNYDIFLTNRGNRIQILRNVRQEKFSRTFETG